MAIANAAKNEHAHTVFDLPNTDGGTLNSDHASRSRNLALPISDR